MAQAGDHIIVANTGQPYRESLTLTGHRHSGSPLGPLVISGNGAVLDGRGEIPPERWEYVAGDVFCVAPALMGTQQLYSGPRPALRRPVAADAVSLPPLAPGEWCWWNSKFHFRVEADKLPDDYALSCCRLRTAFILYYVHDVVIENFVIQGYQTDGITVADVADAVLIQGVVSRGNGRAGIAVAGVARVELNLCLLAANGETQLLNETSATTRVYDSRLTDDTAPAVSVHGGQVLFPTDAPQASNEQRTKMRNNVRRNKSPGVAERHVRGPNVP
jgi:hypothetical protein